MSNGWLLCRVEQTRRLAGDPLPSQTLFPAQSFGQSSALNTWLFQASPCAKPPDIYSVPAQLRRIWGLCSLMLRELGAEWVFNVI